MLLVQLSPLGILGKIWGKVLADMLKVCDTIHSGRCAFPTGKEREKISLGVADGKGEHGNLNMNPSSGNY